LVSAHHFSDVLGGGLGANYFELRCIHVEADHMTSGTNASRRLATNIGAAATHADHAGSAAQLVQEISMRPARHDLKRAGF
jgi:hypothetical protein